MFKKLEKTPLYPLSVIINTNNALIIVTMIKAIIIDISYCPSTYLLSRPRSL